MKKEESDTFGIQKQNKIDEINQKTNSKLVESSINYSNEKGKGYLGKISQNDPSRILEVVAQSVSADDYGKDKGLEVLIERCKRLGIQTEKIESVKDKLKGLLNLRKQIDVSSVSGVSGYSDVELKEYIKVKLLMSAVTYFHDPSLEEQSKENFTEFVMAKTEPDGDEVQYEYEKVIPSFYQLMTSKENQKNIIQYNRMLCDLTSSIRTDLFNQVKNEANLQDLSTVVKLVTGKDITFTQEKMSESAENIVVGFVIDLLNEVNDNKDGLKRDAWRSGTNMIKGQHDKDKAQHDGILDQVKADEEHIIYIQCTADNLENDVFKKWLNAMYRPLTKFKIYVSNKPIAAVIIPENLKLSFDIAPVENNLVTNDGKLNLKEHGNLVEYAANKVSTDRFYYNLKSYVDIVLDKKNTDVETNRSQLFSFAVMSPREISSLTALSKSLGKYINDHNAKALAGLGETIASNQAIPKKSPAYKSILSMLSRTEEGDPSQDYLKIDEFALVDLDKYAKGGNIMFRHHKSRARKLHTLLESKVIDAADKLRLIKLQLECYKQPCKSQEFYSGGILDAKFLNRVQVSEKKDVDALFKGFKKSANNKLHNSRGGPTFYGTLTDLKSYYEKVVGFEKDEYTKEKTVSGNTSDSSESTEEEESDHSSIFGSGPG